MSGEITFFELGVEGADKGRNFYVNMFGWKFESGPGGGGWVIEAPNMRGGMHPGDPGGVPYLFVSVDDMEIAATRVRELGGEVEDIDVEGDTASQQRFGRFKLCRDDQA